MLFRGGRREPLGAIAAETVGDGDEVDMMSRFQDSKTWINQVRGKRLNESLMLWLSEVDIGESDDVDKESRRMGQ